MQKFPEISVVHIFQGSKPKLRKGKVFENKIGFGDKRIDGFQHIESVYACRP
jgi:hypothetical protein